MLKMTLWGPEVIAEGNNEDHHETIERTAVTDSAGPLAGGFDRGATRRGDRVQRIAGPWAPAVHHLLSYLPRVASPVLPGHCRFALPATGVRRS